MTNKKTFIRSGNTIKVKDQQTVVATDRLPLNTYTVKLDERANEFFLEVIEDFTLPDRIYGKNPAYADRVINTFMSRSGQTGVLLGGVKGAGKTLLAKQISIMARQHQVPTIVINKDWHGDEFNSFIQSITTSCVVMFDEFEKIYDYQTQRKILTLFDGVFNSRKLFLITTNDDRDISEFMINRPGRVYYHFKFDTLGQDFIEEYLEDRLNDKSRIPEVLKYTQIFSFFNFDMLATAVEEMNRYDESLAEVLTVLNIQPENKQTDTYQIDFKVGDDMFRMDDSYRGFQPTGFEYTIWTDSDMPDCIARNERVASLLAGSGNRNVSTTVSGGQDAANSPDWIEFNSGLIKEFVQAENKFVYSTTHNNVEVQLHVTRNRSLPSWEYNPNAF
jgi:hypothetical protein